jgi:hypothetical protein
MRNGSVARTDVRRPANSFGPPARAVSEPGAFAERAACELLATGETARRLTVDTREALIP